MLEKLSEFLGLVQRQEERKNESINLIASENIISEAVLNIQSSTLSNRYILDDFPNNGELFRILEEARVILSRLFNARYVNLSPLSGMNCMEILIKSLSKEGDRIYVLDPMDGGHGSTGVVCGAHKLKISFLPYNRQQNVIDTDALESAFAKDKPDLIYLDNTLILFYSDIKRLKQITEKYNAPVIYDGSHVLGLVSGGAFPNPLDDGADVLNGSTHKTFFASQKGIILSNDASIMDRVNGLSKDFVSSAHTGSLMALYLAAMEMEKHGQAYAQQVIKNAKKLGEALLARGIKVQCAHSGITDTHQVWVDAMPIDAQEAYRRLANAHINVNAIRIPSIRREGLRLGVAEVTRLGMKEPEMDQIADFFTEALLVEKSDHKIVDKIKAFAMDYRKVGFSLDDDIRQHAKIKRYEIGKVLTDQSFATHKQEGEYDLDDYKTFAGDYVAEVFSKIPGFRGMIIRGGVGRGTADSYSDVDFTCIFDGKIRSIISDYTLRTGMHLYKGITFSGRYVSLADLRDREWTPKMKHAYSFTENIQCSQEVLDIVAEKTRMTEEDILNKIIKNIVELGEICKVHETYRGFNMFSEIYKQYQRGEILVAHLEIDRAIKHIKNIIFDLNGIHYPEEKSYYVRRFRNLELQPENTDRDIEEILEMRRTNETLEKRLEKLIDLAKRVLSFCEHHVTIPDDIYSIAIGVKSIKNDPSTHEAAPSK